MSGAPRTTELDSAALLRRMLLIRRFDETALELIWAKRIEGVVHPCIGQEGSAVGVCAALRDGDRVVSNHRGHGHCIGAGADVRLMMAELFGRAGGYCGGKGGSMHIADFGIGMLGANGIVGAGVPMATGAALADALDGSERVSVTFFGDGATGQGIVYETVNFAALWRLPVLFVCENNGWAADTPLERTIPVAGVAEIFSGHGVPGRVVNAKDVLEVRAAALEAIGLIREGAGPQLLECRTDRWKMHASRQVPMGDPRDAALLDAARERDPIAHLGERMLASGEADQSALDLLRGEVEAEIRNAVAFAEASPLPDAGAALEEVFA